MFVAIIFVIIGESSIIWILVYLTPPHPTLSVVIEFKMYPLKAGFPWKNIVVTAIIYSILCQK